MMAYKAMVLNGLGIGLLPEILVGNEIKSKKLKSLHPEIKLSSPILVTYHGSYPLTFEAVKMIETLKEIIR